MAEEWRKVAEVVAAAAVVAAAVVVVVVVAAAAVVAVVRAAAAEEERDVNAEESVVDEARADTLSRLRSRSEEVAAARYCALN